MVVEDGNGRPDTVATMLRKRKQHRPAITRMHRAASQWMRGLGVPPELIVVGVGNEWTGSVPRFLSLLRDERDPVRMGIRLCTNGFPRAHAFEVR